MSKISKLVKKGRKLLYEKKENEIKRKHIDNIIKKLNKKRSDLKAKLAKEKNKKTRTELSKYISIIKAQVEKGKKVRRNIK